MKSVICGRCLPALRWLALPVVGCTCLKLGAMGPESFAVGLGVAFFTPGVLARVSLLPPVFPSTANKLLVALTVMAVLLVHQQQNVSMLEMLVEDMMAAVLLALAIFFWLRQTAASSRPSPRVYEEELSALPKGTIGLIRIGMLLLHMVVLANAGYVILTSICPIMAVSYRIFLALSSPVDESSESLFMYAVGWLSLMSAGFMLVAAIRQLKAVPYTPFQKKPQISAAEELRALWNYTPARWLPLLTVMVLSGLVLRPYLLSKCILSERTVETAYAKFAIVPPDKTNLSVCSFHHRPARLPSLDLDQTWEHLKDQVESQVGVWMGSPGWKPCVSPQRVAVIIPTTDGGNREKKVVAKLFALLMWQRRQFRIFVVQQWGQGPAMHGLLRNVGYQYILDNNIKPFDCLIFHDPDLLPESYLNVHLCKHSPRHLSPAIHANRYVLPYARSIQGVLAITPSMFQAVNGFSNVYLNNRLQWDDFYARLQRMQIGISQTPAYYGRYLDLQQTVEYPQFELPALRDFAGRCKEDGLSSVARYNLTILSSGAHYLHTRIIVKLRRLPTITEYRNRQPSQQLDLDSFYNCYTFP